ncbi:TIGR03032 family protein [Crocosphaera sp. Alani8]|uniref:TIGR03032 family protein n=1 Tax=Crocosphaera sp. Alani8 TaxID=3038952 RepID=UPI00313D6DD9
MNKAIPSLEINASRQFTSWLYEQKLSLIFTTYQAGKIFFIGLKPDGKLSVFERTLDRCMGLCIDGNSLYVSALYQLWRFENTLEKGQIYDNYDAIYLPQLSYITGDLDIHDIGVPQNNKKPIFINTLFSCLATVSETHSFKPLWKPPFISKLAAEDRCHLNGLAMRNGEPYSVTMVSQSDVAEGWRENRINGGCVMDITNNEIIADGLSMPHSPRWYREKLWILNSGTGELGFIDLETGKFNPVTFCPGYLRGFTLYKDFAVVGTSEIRDNKTFQGLPLDETLATKKATPRCSLLVIDLKTGDIVHSLRIEGVIKELYDVAILPNFCTPMAIGFRSEEIRRVITVE